MSTTTDVYTFRDYMAAVAEDQKAHLLDGIIVMESPPSMRHEELQAFLSCLLVGYVADKQMGKVFGSKAAFKLKGHNAVEPDVVFVAQERLHLATTNYFNGPPDLAVEIISKGTLKLDYEQKKRAYEQSGTRELWIIDYLREQADLYCFEEGRFQPMPLQKGRTFSSRVVPGFRLDVRWLWSDPLPNPAAILKSLLK